MLNLLKDIFVKMTKKLSCPKRMLKVRVTFKTPFIKRTEQMCMTREAMQWNRKNRRFSPYQSIKKIKC